MKTINWGIIGCGNVTEVKSGPAFNMIKGSKLLAVMRRDIKKSEDYAKRHNVPFWYDNADELINNPDIDAVYIATPPDTHAYYAVKAAEAGKTVYVEKPMALNHSQCREMIEACKKNNVKLFAAYYRRALDYFLKIKEIIDKKLIGEVRFVNIRLFYPPQDNDADSLKRSWRVNSDISGGGYFVDLASHQLDILDFIFGPVKNPVSIVKNQAGLYEAEDYVNAAFEFDSGIPGSGVWSFASSVNRTDEALIMGSEGFVKFSFFGFEPIVFAGKDGINTFDLKPPVNIQLQLIKSMIDDINGTGICPSTGESAVRTTKIIDEILKDYRIKDK